MLDSFPRDSLTCVVNGLTEKNWLFKNKGKGELIQKRVGELAAEIDVSVAQRWGDFNEALNVHRSAFAIVSFQGRYGVAHKAFGSACTGLMQ